MRFVIYGIFLTLWVAMWVWTYTCHIKAACCQPAAQESESEIVSLKSPDIPILFYKWSLDHSVDGPNIEFDHDSFDRINSSDRLEIGNADGMRGYVFIKAADLLRIKTKKQMGIQTDCEEAQYAGFSNLTNPELQSIKVY